ncbi:arylphorin subunit alpha-like [Spodoptera litura]|uniref:Arylphorin subunit alpha-like n=1 Tax=Spodoptera litura TaxID=69820 RepID=A0A9J7E7B8_SPOLT|nr:arylphorin subunit alpha-like [Spodoptera litura]
MFRFTLILWLALGLCKSAPVDEFNGFINQGELSANPDGDLTGIVPGYLPQGSQKSDLFSGLLGLHSEYVSLTDFIQKSATLKGLTFNIYNEDMKDVANGLFKLLYNAEDFGYDIEKIINLNEFNDDLVTYAKQINLLYRDKKFNVDEYPPPFITKPNHFVNGETIVKALKLANYINNDIDITDEANVDQYFKTYDILTINSNYSGWNLPENGGEESLNYFREDIGLNSYYYGMHLMHPFWLIHNKLYTANSRSDEHYYYIHQQLASRLYLEKEHLRQENVTKKTEFGDYHPYLIHENGLPFPTRSGTMGDWNEDRAKIKSIDIAIKECMARRLIVIDRKTIELTEENYVKLLTRLFRGNFEVGKVSKVIRSLFGYGGNGYPIEGYNPAPSLLHHPETSLRDPIYWYMMQYVINYFTEFTEFIEPLYMQKDDATKHCEIIEADLPKITTYFNYYQFDISNAVFKTDSPDDRMPLTITARQKRLKHSKFEFNFTVDCTGVKDTIVRLFLGPPCTDRCWEEYAHFFELDKFAFAPAEEGLSTIIWSPEISTRFSDDEYYNLEGSSPQTDTKNNYNLFKFPENLIIPRGTPNGLNLTLFIMITPADEYLDEHTFIKFFREIRNDLDNKPAGYPFNRPAVGYYDDAPNYKFYNITIYHKKNHISKNGYFSPHLH